MQIITDRILLEKDSWTETELTASVQQYYKEMFNQNTYEGILASVKDAYMGYWEQISRYNPFGDDYLRLPIFVPWEPDESEIETLCNKTRKILYLKDSELQMAMNHMTL